MTDSDWTRMNPALPGVGVVGCAAMVARGNDVYVGGGFRMAGDVQANGLARWDGTKWNFVAPGGTGLMALALDSSGNLYVAGNFQAWGGVAAKNVAKWDGHAWSALGAGLDNEVYALAIDRQGRLHAGGYFLTSGGDSAKRIAMWDGTRWNPVGGGVDSSVRAFAQDAAGNLFAGGDFTHAGGVAAPHVARWDGNSWSAVGSGTDSSVHALTISGGDLYAGGWFTEAGGAPASRVARWDGATWNPLGTGTNYPMEALVPRPAGGVYAAGQFRLAGGDTALGVAAWDGADWHSLQDTLVVGLALALDTAGNLYAGGINYSDGISRLNIGKWDGRSWTAMGGGGFYGAVNALAGDTSGTVWFASRYFIPGGWGFQHVIRWKEGKVEFLPDLGGQISALALASDGSLFAAGAFGDTASLEPLVHRWTNGAWSIVGSGMVGHAQCLLADTLGNVYAGGSLRQVGGTAVEGVAKWDGHHWTPVGSGMKSTVRFLAWGDSGRLYAAGDMSGVWRWNGSAWTSVGSLGYAVHGLAVDDSGFVYASIMYQFGDAQTPFNVVRWNGAKWELLGKGFNSLVNLLVSDGNTVYVGGSFRGAFDTWPSHVARWTGTTWEPLGSGIDGDPWAFLVRKGLVVGGDFQRAGAWTTPGLARLEVPYRRQTADVDARRTATYGDGPWTVRATSGLPVVVTSSDPSVARGSGDTVAVRGAGTATLQAYQAGDRTWLPLVRRSGLEVLPKPVAASGARARDRVYDGTTAATVSYDTLVGVLPGDSVALVPGVAKFADRHAGTSKLVTDSGVALGGRSARNYSLVPFPLLADISRRPDTVKAHPIRKSPGMADPELTYSASPLCPGDERTGSLERDSGDTVGTYSIRIGTLSDGPDYEMVFQTAPFVIQVPDALAVRPVKTARVVQPEIRLDRVLVPPSRTSGPGELSPRAGAPSDDRARADILLSSPGSVSVSIFDHMGTPVIGWSDRIEVGALRRLPPSGEGRRTLSVSWNLRSAGGVPVSTGVYLWRISVVSDDGRKLDQVLKLGVSGIR